MNHQLISKAQLEYHLQAYSESSTYKEWNILTEFIHDTCLG